MIRKGAGPKQHIVPASYLGRFSFDNSMRSRRRRLWVRERGASTSVVRQAKDVAWALDIYGTADFAWTYENRLPLALDAVEANTPLDWQLWMEVLVPFVAALFVRSPEFLRQFELRFHSDLARRFAGVSARDRGSGPRLMEYQHLLAPVMAMRWAVLHQTTSTPLVTSDAAFAATETPLGLGYFIPVSPNAALVLAQAQSRQALRWTGRWIAPIEHFYTQDQREINRWNRSVAAFARRLVVGPSQIAVSDAASTLATAPEIGSGFVGGLADVDLGCHLYDYFRVLSALNVNPLAAGEAADKINWLVATRRWEAPVAVEILFPERTVGGVIVADGELTIDLSLGLLVRRHRQAAGDFRCGALAQIDAKRIGEIAPPVGHFDRPVSLASVEENIILGMGTPREDAPHLPPAGAASTSNPSNDIAPTSSPSLLPDDKPRLITFLFRLPEQVPLPDGLSTEAPDFKDLGTAWDISAAPILPKPWGPGPRDELGEPRAVNMRQTSVHLRVWQVVRQDRLSMAMRPLDLVAKAVYRRPPNLRTARQSLSVLPNDRDTVIEATTQAAVPDEGVGEIELVSACFSRCLRATNWLVWAYSSTQKVLPLDDIAPPLLDPFAYVASRPAGSDSFDVDPQLLALESIAWRMPEILSEDQTADVFSQITDQVVNPLAPAGRMLGTGVRSAVEQNYGQAIAIFDLGIRMFVNMLLRLMDAESAAAGKPTTDPPAELRTTIDGLAVHLGGDWRPLPATPIGDWWESLIALRERTERTSIEVTKRECDAAREACKAVADFIADRLVASIDTYPLTALTALDEDDLRRRGIEEDRIARLATFRPALSPFWVKVPRQESE